ncbi:MAG: nickel-dependent hydrogenase large subunit [Lachnospiraceae bacterium]|nr:nickel-dependent hydrogenase large subunit [Lachnospiraceae bacterium]
MGKRSVIPFGPQHPVLPEPIHLDLVVEDERVVEAIPNIGFIHRGLEGLAPDRDFQKYLYVVERTCGICSFGHGLGYVESIEGIMNVEVPEKARYLRVIWAEMARMTSHLMWLGFTADAFGFESLFYQAWRIRERVLDLMEMTTGGRLIYSVLKVGGVLRDISPEMQKKILDDLNEIEKETRDMTKTFLDDYSVQTRLKGVGVLTKQQAHDVGACGPMARASGIACDMRMRGYEAYADLGFEPVVSQDGDSYARCEVRTNEIFASIELVRRAFAKMPKEGDLATAFKGNPNGEYFARIEQPRGEAIFYSEGHGKPTLDRFRLRTPTFANLQALCETLKGAEYADVPILILTIDPCISCTER